MNNPHENVIRVVSASVLGSRGRDRSASTRAAGTTIAELLFLLSWLQNLEAAHESIVDGHHGAGIVELSAVVRRGEECNELTLSEEFVAVFNDLMRAANQIYVMFLSEC